MLVFEKLKTKYSIETNDTVMRSCNKNDTQTLLSCSPPKRIILNVITSLDE
jgi:hypothetical protein